MRFRPTIGVEAVDCISGWCLWQVVGEAQQGGGCLGGESGLNDQSGGLPFLERDDLGLVRLSGNRYSLSRVVAHWRSCVPWWLRTR